MFYVYTLADPRDGSVFYVGKGKGNRIEAHEKEAKRGKQSKKCDRIREIWAAGLEVVRAEVKQFECEREAYRHEAELIAKMKDALTNVAPGGGRLSGNQEFSSEEKIAAKFCIALLSKITKPNPSHVWSAALHKAMSHRADDWLKEYAPLVNRGIAQKMLRKRGVDLIFSD